MNANAVEPTTASPRLDDRGRIDLGSLEEIPLDDLGRWVAARLASLDLVVPGAACPGDMPHALLAALYSAGGPRFRRCLEEVIRGFVRKLAIEPEAPWSGEPGRELLMLVDPVLMGPSHRAEVIDLLLRIVAPGLRDRALQGLVALHYRNRVFWEGVADGDDPSLTPVVLGGLAEDGPDAVFNWLSGRGDDPSVRDAMIGLLPNLVDVHGLQAVNASILRVAPRLGHELLASILQFHDDEGWTPPTRVAAADVNRVRREVEEPVPEIAMPEAVRGQYRSGGMRIYVGNLNYSVTSDDLRAMFEPYGTVAMSEVQIKSRTGQSRGFGIVQMANVREAEAAIAALNNREHLGRPLTVNESRPRRTVGDQYASGGWYGSDRSGR